MKKNDDVYIINNSLIKRFNFYYIISYLNKFRTPYSEVVSFGHNT
jgi:hypothetical protein